MLAPFVIVYREVLEIVLVLSVLLTATRGLSRRGLWVGSGLLGGVGASFLVAFSAKVIYSAMEGLGQELLNACVLTVAAALIAWTVIWMRRNGSSLGRHYKQVGQSVKEGRQPVFVLALIVALTVVREGSEIVLFLYGLIAGGTHLAHLAVGSGLGILSGILTGAVLYYGLLRIPIARVLTAASVLLVFLAAGMVSQALSFLSAAGWVPEIIPAVYDASKVIPENGFVGRLLHLFFGYSERPSLTQLIGYLTTVGAIFLKLRWTAPRRSALAVLFAGLSVLVWPDSALATNKVYSPIVEKGEIEIEARGNYDFDSRESKDGAQEQKYALGYGVTDRWFTEVYGEIEKETSAQSEDGAEENKSRAFDFNAVEWENRLQLFDQGQYWLDAGLYFSYEWAVNDGAADKIEGKLLLEKQIQEFVHTVNLTLEKEVGGGPKEQLEGALAWSSRYRWKPYLEPGVEYYAEFGEFKERHSFNEQTHQVGPVLYGRIGNHIKYDIGYLFGISDAAPAGRLKWIIEFEWRF